MVWLSNFSPVKPAAPSEGGENRLMYGLLISDFCFSKVNNILFPEPSFFSPPSVVCTGSYERETKKSSRKEQSESAGETLKGFVVLLMGMLT